MSTSRKVGTILCGGALLGTILAAAPSQNSQVKCEHAAPPEGMHYVCDNPQKPCYCRLEADDARSDAREKQDKAPAARIVWLDTKHKKYYCTGKRPPKLGKHSPRVTEEEARRRGYKPAPKC